MLDPSTFPMLVWIYSTRYYQPDFVMQENVKNFDCRILADILEETEDVLKCCSMQDHVAVYASQILKGSPMDLAFPTAGVRQFMVSVAEGSGSFTIDASSAVFHNISDFISVNDATIWIPHRCEARQMLVGVH